MKATILNESTRSEIVKAVSQLLEAHELPICHAMDGDESKEFSVKLSINIDCTNHEPAVTVTLNYTPLKVKDVRIVRCIDPSQPELGLEVLTPEEADEKDEDALALDEKSEEQEEAFDELVHGPKKRGRSRKEVEA